MRVSIDEERIKRMKRKHRDKKKKNKIIIIAVIFLIVLAIIGIIFLKFRKNDNRPNFTAEEKKIVATLIGKWTTDGNTVYEFNEDGSGALIVPVANLPFTYKFENNRIFIDFENEDSEDMFYTYEVTDTKLTLKSVNGTFEFSRVEE